jgi:single-stranded-DNA-specific exonuclease
MDKIWQVAERRFDDLRQQISASRLLETEQDQRDFFNPNLDQLLSPWDFPQMEVAAKRIAKAIETRETMVVWGDFDADGVCSTAVLWETLHELGGNVLPYIPVRDTEGHGFSDKGLKKLAEDGTTLVITVDHGVTAFEDIELARDLGMEVIITDHHEPRRHTVEEEQVQGNKTVRKQVNGAVKTYNLAISLPGDYVFPDCVAVIHPFRLEERQPLAGCGVAYFLAYGVWLRQRKIPSVRFQESGREPTTNDRELRATDTSETRREFALGRMELVAMGTVADLMPLTMSNRVFASIGLTDLARTRRIGLQCLYEVAGLKPDKSLSVYEIGFLIGPRLNAPGRLGDALESLRLLCTKDAERAKGLALALNVLNEQRQDLLTRVSKEAQLAAAKRPELQAFVLANKDWPAGVCGLAAGKVVEQMYRPAVVMELQGDIARGSARSIKGFDFTAALTSMTDLLESFGGHAMAAGFVAKTANLPEIERQLSDLVTEQLSSEQLQPRLMVDAEVDLFEMDFELWDFLKKLEPCGMGNPQPVFVAREVMVVSCKAIGKEGKHLKLALRGSKNYEGGGRDNSLPLDAIAFGFGLMGEKLLGKRVNVVFNLEENVWNGKASLQLKVKDIKLFD